jgi:acyl dehydratase
MTGVAFADVEVGTLLPAPTFPLERADLVRYAGASGDFNPIHWSEQTAVAVGLPGVIAHGMLTMAMAVRVVTDWVGDPGALVSYGVRFTRPVPVEFGEVTELQVSGKVRARNEVDQTVEVELSALVGGQTVLAKARVTVRLGS